MTINAGSGVDPISEGPMTPFRVAWYTLSGHQLQPDGVTCACGASVGSASMQAHHQAEILSRTPLTGEPL